VRKKRLQVTIDPELVLILHDIAHELDVSVSEVVSIIIRGQWSKLPESLQWWYGISAATRVRGVLDASDLHRMVAQTNRVK